ncbi:MAG: FmdE family protein [Syntrophobacteraceae bacterium]
MLKAFHGSEAPGLIIGGFMVDTAVRHLPDGILYDAICETRACLPDAVQLLTPCTVGNGWLKVIPFGRFAITLYDKYNYEGVRVFVDPEKLKTLQEIHNWFFKLKSKKEQDKERLIREIAEAGSSVLSIQKVRVRPELVQKSHKGKIAVCPQCKEAYPENDGSVCLSCQGGNPYL